MRDRQASFYRSAMATFSAAHVRQHKGEHAMRQTYSVERVNTVVVGGGQAGLSVGYLAAPLGFASALYTGAVRRP